jgi:hypothetical protein
MINLPDGVYYVKTDIAGDTEDKLLLYLRENKGMYEQFVKKEVALRDTLPAEDATLIVKTSVAKYEPTPSTRRKLVSEDVAFATLKEEAKSLGIKGIHLFSEKNLHYEVQKIKDAKKKETQVAE